MSEQVTVSCATCGCEFWMPVRFNGALMRSGNTFYCPSGHPQKYTGEVEKLKKEIETLTSARDSARRDCDFWMRKASAPVYRCVVAGCDESRGTKASMRKHLETVHGFFEKNPRALPANAGPSN